MNFLNYIFLLLSFSGCQLITDLNKPAFKYDGKKLKGVSFVATSKPIGIETYEPLKNLNATWITLMPYGFARTTDATFTYNDGSNANQYWGETPAGIAACISMAHEKGLKVMVKPHVWLSGGAFTGDMDFKTDTEWQKFEPQYAKYVLRFAKVADSLHAESFCMATEFKTFVQKRPTFWNQLIKDIKTIYKGKLTYAENWDSYSQVPFWNQLDFIGIDAYFPLSDEQNPSLQTIKKGWSSTIKDLDKFSKKEQKPILFTEFGYRSIDYAVSKPWDSYTSYPDNENLQANAYQAFFDEIWQKEWFAGAFVWKWFPTVNIDKSRDKFSPQGKKAEIVLKENYAK